MHDMTRRKIEEASLRVLRDAGFREPPVCLDSLLSCLDLDRDYYNLTDPSFIRAMGHKLRIGKRRLIEVVKKTAKLQAVLLFGESRILIDASLPEKKQLWPGYHEAGHRICGWHASYFGFGDTAQTLVPEYQDMLEAEANYAASDLMFCGQVFTTEARDTPPRWESVEELSTKRYRQSLTTTLRRYVGFGPVHVMAAMIGTPCWKEGADNEPGSWRHFVPSPLFASQFSRADPDHMNELVNQHARVQSGGKVASFTMLLADDNGDPHEFLAEAFFNRHDLLMMFVHQRRLNTRGTVVVPESIQVDF